MINRLAQLRSLMKQPAAQEHIAATAGLAAREADREGKGEGGPSLAVRPPHPD